MNVGLPGTGVGGLFYLLSALLMPVRETYGRLRSRAGPGGWRLVLKQGALAGGILAGMWVTGWLLGRVLAVVPPVAGSGALAPTHNVLRFAALFLGLATLGVVLLGVELLRLWLPRPSRRWIAPEIRERQSNVPGVLSLKDHILPEPPKRRRVSGATRLLSILGVIAAAQALNAQTAPRAFDRLARADSAYASGNAADAEREYSAVLAADPWNSRATYRLAGLLRRDPRSALRLYRRYVELEPTDLWGYLAVAELLSRSGDHAAALDWYDRALTLRPTERDAVLGHARALARAQLPGSAVAAYTAWLASHPDDAEALREVEAQRLKAAAAVEPLVRGSWDSDGNGVLRLGARAEFRTSGAMRLGVETSREQVSSRVASASLDHFALRSSWRLRGPLAIDASAGATRIETRGTLIPTGQLRARWRPPVGPRLEIRVDRQIPAASPALVTNRVLRTEVRSVVELPIGHRLRIRGLGRAAVLSDDALAGSALAAALAPPSRRPDSPGRPNEPNPPDPPQPPEPPDVTLTGRSLETNHRTAFGAVVAFAASPALEVSGQAHEIRYSHVSAAGYFAPRIAQVMEAGTYLELETASAATFVIDAGAGVLRVGEFGAAVGPWRGSLRLYALATLPLAPGRDLRIELEGEDSPVAREAAATGVWRFGSASVSLRWALP